MSDLLTARESRHFRIQELHDTFNLPLISIKANIPGENKNISEAYLLVRLFLNELKPYVSIKYLEYKESMDGPYYLIVTLKDNHQDIKSILVGIEDTHPLGRFVDLDFYLDGQKSVSRGDLKLPFRKCYLCENDAHDCSRNQTHTIKELTSFIHKSIEKYLFNLVTDYAEKAMLYELNIEHKFGLVTKTTMGSHSDMTYDLMLKAQKVIIPYFGKMFIKGYRSNDIHNLFIEAREIGISAEEEMLKETGGINCYKGLIFVLGLVMLSTGYMISHHQQFDLIFKNVQNMTKDLLKEFDRDPITFGEQAFHTHQVKGARGEAYLGFPTIHLALVNLEYKDSLSDSALRGLLQMIILSTDDTVLLKRAGTLERYMMIKRKLSEVDTENLDEVIEFTKYCIKENISFGGSADLLVSTIFLFLIKKKLY
ncbi:MAG: citrate lyase holo-[acyl-carrier protein] synthase [Acholeplasmataceae bacterium]|nr:citrate lyase holo-[acyl-carrier protein] synthase [Acholeplasmataceae bacterium]